MNQQPDGNTVTPTPLASALAMTIELAINKALTADPATRIKLNALNGRTLQINCSQPTLKLQFLFCENQVLVNGNSLDDADAQVSGSAEAFLRAATQQNNHTLADTGLTVQGNANLLTHIQEIAKNIDLDWEDLLTPIAPPALTHIAATGIRALTSWAKETKSFIEENAANVLTDELHAIPAQQELNTFYDDVDNVAAKAQRLEAKLNAYFAQKNNIKNNIKNN